MGIMAGVTLASVTAFVMTYALLQSNLDDSGSARTNTTGTVAGVEDTNPSPTDAPAAPTAPVDITVTDQDHVRGDKNAPVTIVEYSDFECPFCARHLPTVEKIMQEYDGQVRLIYRHFPLSFHPQAQKAAEASECASEQGKFWEMHDKLFAMNEAGTLSLENFKKAAGELGLKQAQFDSCLNDGKYADRVQSDFSQGSQYGVNGTPATFVNGKLVSGAVPFESFKTVIDQALAD